MISPALVEHFDALHAGAADPWSVDRSWFEIRRRGLVLALLPDLRIGRAFEPGCSTGALTEALAERCDELLAMDCAPAAVATCRDRVAGHDGVEVTVGVVPDDWPDGPFDLVVLSEMAYYLESPDLDLVVDACRRSLRPGGHLLAAHWRRVADDFRLAGGDEVHLRLRAAPGLRRTAGYADPETLIDLFEVPA